MVPPWVISPGRFTASNLVPRRLHLLRPQNRGDEEGARGDQPRRGMGANDRLRLGFDAASIGPFPQAGSLCRTSSQAGCSSLRPQNRGGKEAAEARTGAGDPLWLRFAAASVGPLIWRRGRWKVKGLRGLGSGGGRTWAYGADQRRDRRWSAGGAGGSTGGGARLRGEGERLGWISGLVGWGNTLWNLHVYTPYMGFFFYFNKKSK